MCVCLERGEIEKKIHVLACPVISDYNNEFGMDQSNYYLAFGMIKKVICMFVDRLCRAQHSVFRNCAVIRVEFGP